VIACEIGKSGSISVRLARPGRGESELFTSQDVSFIFKKGIKQTVMSSDELEDRDSEACTPALQWRHSPQELAGSDYLATMVQCNWLITMLGVGVEMSSIAPFNIRTSEQLLNRLPSHVQNALKINTQRLDICNYWIEAGPLQFVCLDHDDGWRFEVGEISMRVVARGADPGSAEDQFARAFTSHWKTIASVFPEFARLEELTKLSELFGGACAIRNAIRDAMARIDETAAVSQALDRIQNDLPYVWEWDYDGARALTSAVADLIRDAFGATGVDSLISDMIDSHRVPHGLLLSCAEAAKRRKQARLSAVITTLNTAAGEPAQQSIGDGVKVPLPSIYTFKNCMRIIGGVLLDPPHLPFFPALRSCESIDVAGLSVVPARPSLTPSSWDTVPTMEGTRVKVSAVVQSPRPVAIVLVGLQSSARSRWSVPVETQKRFCEYEGGRLPPAEVQELMWQVRYGRLVRELHKEVQGKHIATNVRSYQRAPSVVAETGYDLELDPNRAVVLEARELSIMEWNALRLIHGLNPME
jgi:hypothetical protein